MRINNKMSIFKKKKLNKNTLPDESITILPPLKNYSKATHCYHGFESDIKFTVDYEKKTIEVDVDRLTVQEFYSGLKEMAIQYRPIKKNSWGYDSELMFDVGHLDFHEDCKPSVDLIFIIQKDWDISKIGNKLTNGLLLVRGEKYQCQK